MRHMNKPLIGASCGGEAVHPVGVEARGDDGRLFEEEPFVPIKLRPRMDLRGREGDDMMVRLCTCRRCECLARY